jgi:sugar phosphate isomerase/epimerase
MVDFSLKAAAIDMMQLKARAGAMSAQSLPINLELHTFGARDIDTPDTFEKAAQNVEQLRQEQQISGLVVHVPLQSVSVVTRCDFDIDQCRRGIEFAHRVGANAVVLHRYWGLVFGKNARRAVDKTAAEAAFNEVVKDLANAANGMRLLVENVGHYSLLPRDGESYLAGPLDHFFPWEIARFRAFLKREQLHNVEPFVDVAHATLSSNLFNRKRAFSSRLADDPRFVGIDDEDLDKTEWLNPFDFVDNAMPYLHASDALILHQHDVGRTDLSDAELTRSIVSEGLELGAGSLPFESLPGYFGQSGTIVLEVDPGVGETHVENDAQCRSLSMLRDIYANRTAGQ